jgi:hypothetical protein
MKEYKGLCPQCHEEEIYSHALTKGLCLNCYSINQEEEKRAYIEAENDYWDGCSIF